MSLATHFRINPTKPILLTFDAFGTLYSPRAPIECIYHECARKHGITNIETSTVRDQFRQAFKWQIKHHPNYGSRTGLRPDSWWRDIVTDTFENSGLSSNAIAATADDLWQIFSSAEGYKLEDGAGNVFETLRQIKKMENTSEPSLNITTGVITNSDPRASDVLSSLGLKVGSPTTPSNNSTEDGVLDSSTRRDVSSINDIDLVVTSYIFGVEKPSTEIFDAALKAAGFTREGANRGEIQAVHVGDDSGKDCIGAQKAGWQAILIDRSGTSVEPACFTVPGLNDIDKWLRQVARVQTIK